jgi:hypothetical protein
VSTKLTRLTTSAFLITFAAIIGIGAAILLPIAHQRANADASEALVAPCTPQSWLHVNRDCLSRRGLPWITASGGPIVAPLEVVAAAIPTDKLSPPDQHDAQSAEDATQLPAQSKTQETAADQSAAPTLADEPPAAPKPQVTQAAAVVGTSAETPPSIADKGPTAGTAKRARSKTESREKQLKRTATTGDHLRQARNPGSRPQEIPVSSYTADGTPRTVIIRPTSIQDSYFYSAR